LTPLCAWAYTFGCDLSLVRVCMILNVATGWRWHHQDDSVWYLEYLICRPRPSARIRIHNLQERDKFGPIFSVQLDAECDSRAEVDAAFRSALGFLPIRDLCDSATYD